MPMSEFIEYIEAMKAVKARELLYQITVADFPHLKNPKRRSTHQKLVKAAFPNTRQASQSITMEQMAAVMNKKGTKTSGTTR
jgi:hypothetical protein